MTDTTLAPAICEKCGKEITGTRILTSDGRIICENCFRSEQTTYASTSINITIDIFQNGDIEWHDFDCGIYTECEKCQNLKLCLRLREELDKLVKSFNEEAKK